MANFMLCYVITVKKDTLLQNRPTYTLQISPSPLTWQLARLSETQRPTPTASGLHHRAKWMASRGCSSALSAAGWHRHMLIYFPVFGARWDTKVDILEPSTLQWAGLQCKSTNVRWRSRPTTSQTTYKASGRRARGDRWGSTTSPSGIASPWGSKSVSEVTTPSLMPSFSWELFTPCLLHSQKWKILTC